MRPAQFSRINLDRQLQLSQYRDKRHASLAGSIWTGNYNLKRREEEENESLAGSIWTGNYNRSVTCLHMRDVQEP